MATGCRPGRSRDQQRAARSVALRSQSPLKKGEKVEVIMVAKIVPAKEPVWDRSAVLDEAEALRKKLKIKGRFKIVDLIAAGRL